MHSPLDDEETESTALSWCTLYWFLIW